MAPVARAQHSIAVYSCAPQGHKGVAAHTQAGTVEGTTGGRGEQRGDQAGEKRRQDLTVLSTMMLAPYRRKRKRKSERN